MTERRSRPPSILLEPPSKGAELEDTGAQPSSCESEEDHFSDASEGISPRRESRTSSPIPRTRVEKIDNSPSYGEIPGSPAYEKRELDAFRMRLRLSATGHLADHHPAQAQEQPRPQTWLLFHGQSSRKSIRVHRATEKSQERTPMKPIKLILLRI
ncbi:hypothetical protein ACJ72_02979 [Emergomyces africanus]|uniref:Uncharacterized protein n=1 Tax=Emergomyces africanus TaxID=1955775 RepID=A0A1B7P0W1_9EURO|nr:hypothetical protein ACJ72_02979 [Emergomyces africanus]